MKILLLGKDGQVGWQLQRALAPLGEVHACGRADCDMTDAAAIHALVGALRPAVRMPAISAGVVLRVMAIAKLSHRKVECRVFTGMARLPAGTKPDCAGPGGPDTGPPCRQHNRIPPRP